MTAHDPGWRRVRMHCLHDPAFSLGISQRYPHDLARHDALESAPGRLLAADGPRVRDAPRR